MDNPFYLENQGNFSLRRGPKARVSATRVARASETLVIQILSYLGFKQIEMELSDVTGTKSTSLGNLRPKPVKRELRERGRTPGYMRPTFAYILHSKPSYIATIKTLY